MAKIKLTWDGPDPRTGEPARFDTGLRFDTEYEDQTTTPKSHMQDLIDLSSLSDADWTDIDAALTTLETKLGAKLLDLTTEQRSRLTKMGDKSEAFCRQALVVCRQNDGKLPPDTVTDLTAEEGDLANLDKLRLRLTRLTALNEKAGDSEMALGSDIMVFCLAAYGLLKAIGAGAGLDALKSQLGARFAKGPAKPAAPGAH
jgi:hypothetical protein